MIKCDPRRDGGLRDPRLWSNLRGMVRGENAPARAAAHNLLDCRKEMIREAYEEGWERHGTLPPDASIFLFGLTICLAIVAATRKKERS